MAKLNGRMFLLLYGHQVCNLPRGTNTGTLYKAGLKITAGQWTMSSHKSDLKGQKFDLPVMLTWSLNSFLTKQSNLQL